MQNTKMFDAVSKIDEDLIEACLEANASALKKQREEKETAVSPARPLLKKHPFFYRAIAVAAFVAVLAASITALAVSGGRLNTAVIDPPEPPIFDDETALEDGIRISLRNLLREYYDDAARVIIDLPGKTVEVSCDNNYLYASENNKDGWFTAADKQLSVTKTEAVKIRGLRIENSYSESSYSLENLETTVRMIIREDGEIVGYAMACFWEPDGPQNCGWFNDGKVVKAVLFDDTARGRITEDEVNARLDALYDEYVIGAKLFESHTENRVSTVAG